EGGNGAPRTVKRRGLLAGAAAFVAMAMASRSGGWVEAESAPAPKTQRVLYDMQSPDVWYEDFGEGTLAGGKAEITIAADFAAAVDTANYHVFLTSHDPASKGLAVAARQSDRFVVQEHAGGMSNLTFSWRMVARPKGSTAARMPTLTLPDIKIPDPRMLPPPPPVPPLPPLRQP
ncbi:MAG: hypothetical protein LC793_11290, partial [Thermomicrobia bacterium]|nr:hypothetical protein [Thermomicrobia bacterium]